jgi:hypothetical protein
LLGIVWDNYHRPFFRLTTYGQPADRIAVDRATPRKEAAGLRPHGQRMLFREVFSRVSVVVHLLRQSSTSLSAEKSHVVDAEPTSELAAAITLDEGDVVIRKPDPDIRE